MSITHTMIEYEYREAVEKYGKESAFQELEKLYKHEKQQMKEDGDSE